MKTKKAKTLTENQREKFVKRFYLNWPDSPTDLESSNPWGCPWEWDPDAILTGDSIEEMADNYYQEQREDIEEQIKEEEECREEEEDDTD